MSDYSQIVAYGPKDALITGDAAKRIKGVEIDAEFAAIATAVASKVNTSALTANAGILGDLGALTDPGADRLLFWDFSAGAAAMLTVGSGLTLAGTTISASAGGGGDALTTNPLSQFAATTSAQLRGVLSDETGTGAAVFANGPTLIAPVLGTVAAGSVLTNATNLPISTGVSGLAAGIATFLATPSSANLKTAVTDETGSGALVFANGPTFIAPALGTPASGNLSLCTGLNAVEVTKYKDADLPKTTDTTLADDDDLFGYSLAASSYYRIEGCLGSNHTDSGGDMKVAFQTTFAFTDSQAIYDWHADNDGWTSGAGSISVTDVSASTTILTSAFGRHCLEITGWIITNGACTVDFQWAQNSPSGTATLKKGSWIRLTKMN